MHKEDGIQCKEQVKENLCSVFVFAKTNQVLSFSDVLKNLFILIRLARQNDVL